MNEDDVVLFERTVNHFLDDNAGPEAIARWRKQKVVDDGLWKRAGEAGLLGVSTPEDYGGSGGDFRHEVAIMQAIGHRGADVFVVSLHNAVILPYLTSFGTEEQKRRWLPRLCSGELIGAIAMTEPGAGSDLQGMRASAQRTESGYSLSGQKTFITNGQIANLILVAARTDPSAGSKGISLFIVETDGLGPEFVRGQNFDKIGQEGQDTSELFFDGVKLGTEHVLGGRPGAGLGQLMAKLPQERLVIAWQAMAMIERALDETIQSSSNARCLAKHWPNFKIPSSS